MATDKTLADLASRLDRLESLLVHRLPPNVDPVPDDWGRWPGSAWWQNFVPIRVPTPNPGDPVPVDLSRFSKAQLELTLTSINAQRIRLDALEGLVKSQLKQTR